MRFSIGGGVLLGFGILGGGHADTPDNDADQHPPGAATVPGEVLADWRAQDGIEVGTTCKDAITAIVGELKTKAAGLQLQLQQREKVPLADPRWEQLYRDAGVRRRAVRLRTLLTKAPRIVFTQHYDLGGSHYAYTDGQSAAQH